MIERPRPPSWNQHNAAAFQLADVVQHYHLRAPYPSTLAPFLLELAVPRAGCVLELGCGTGTITRALAPHVERIDAIDVSRLMIEKARAMPGGGHPSIRWVGGRAEDAPFEGPYALAVAGASLHWMDWETVLPRITGHLVAGAVLAVVVASEVPTPWADEVQRVVSRYSVIQNFQKADLVAELEQRELFRRVGERSLEPEQYAQTVDEYLDGYHANSGLARERMGAERARAFDDEMRALVAPHATAGVLALAAGAEITWGTSGASNLAEGHRRPIP